MMKRIDPEQFDAKKGATWHCIVGRNFGSFVTHGMTAVANIWMADADTDLQQRRNISSTSTLDTSPSCFSKHNNWFYGESQY